MRTLASKLAGCVCGFFLAWLIASRELLTGIGPVTSALPMRRTTYCATAARPVHALRTPRTLWYHQTTQNILPNGVCFVNEGTAG